MRGLLLVLAWVGCTSAAPPEPAVPRALPAPTAAALEAEGPVPYGYWGLNGYVSPAGLADVRARLGANHFHTATVSPRQAATELLPLARAAGMTVTLRMTGGHGRYTTRSGDFDLAAWKRMLAPWGREPALRPFIEDGTLRGHMILDDIHNFEGHDPTGDELDEMARTSQELLPGLMTFVRERATHLPVPTGGRFVHLDACVNQYKAAHGDVAVFAADQAIRAGELELGIINGLNIANGGDGSSGQPGWGEGKWAMSAEEIARYGAVLAAVPTMGMFMNWEYDGEERWSDGSIGAAWFDRPAQQAALAALGQQVRAHPPIRLRRPDPPALSAPPAPPPPGASPGP